MATETEFFACLLVCGPPRVKPPAFSGRYPQHSHWLKVRDWYLDTHKNFHPPWQEAYSFWERYQDWWKEQSDAR